MFLRSALYTVTYRHLQNTTSFLGSKHLALLARKPFVVELVQNVLDRSNVSCNKDWKKIRQSILEHQDNKGQCSVDNIDALILNYCLNKNTDWGLSYIDYLKTENMKKNLATVGKYLQLMYLKNEKFLMEGEKCSSNDVKNIIDCYENLRKEHSLLDYLTLESAILALSVTGAWKQCLEIMKESEITTVISSRAYSAVIAAIFLNDKHELGWNLLNDMLEKEKLPLSLPFITYINVAKKSEEAKSMLEKLLLFFQENDFICDEDVISNLISLVDVVGLQGTPVNVTQNGQCNHCQESLEKYELSTDEFEDLRKVFFENVLIGKDVFLKSNPNELNNFKIFFKKMDTFDVVLDGLNIAYRAGASSPKLLSAMVVSVVAHFVRQNKRILVLGRQHMKNWPLKNWDYITKNSTVFLTENISQDDPYLLYCALNSGKDTILVTNDFMRGHKFRLKSPKHKQLFSRWLSQRQYHIATVTAKGRPIFRYPTPFNVTAQRNGNSWHIPYKQVDNKNEYHNTWFCIKWK